MQRSARRATVTSSSRDVTETIPLVTRVNVAPVRVAAIAVRPNQNAREPVQACVNVGEAK
ncbi:MAG TPA: hypothetical protein VIF32_03700 [Gemmatimonadaceae bacterium]